MISNPIKVLCLPSYHWYMRKFDDGKYIKFVNPDSDFFMGTNVPNEDDFSQLSHLENLKSEFKPTDYDIVHIHFEYQSIPLNTLKRLLDYFDLHKKPIVWTLHDRKSNDSSYHNPAHDQLLFKRATKVITLTQGCKTWIKQNFGEHKNEIEVLQHGYIESPKTIKRLSKKIAKNPNLYTMLIGNFRPNKEILDSVANFLLLTELSDTKLRLMFNPFTVYSPKNVIDVTMTHFLALIKNNQRIDVQCFPFIEHDLITKAFLESHAIILPYKWGTHSGQIELARDCGCYVVVPNVGFYQEQWEQVELWDAVGSNKELHPTKYAEALITVHEKKSLNPNPDDREKEFDSLLKRQYLIYKGILERKNEK